MVEAAGYVPVALTADDYVGLLPARWHAVNAYGIKVNRCTYDGPELNPFRQQPSGVKAHKPVPASRSVAASRTQAQGSFIQQVLHP
jgi:hypothetical protein